MLTRRLTHAWALLCLAAMLAACAGASAPEAAAPAAPTAAAAAATLVPSSTLPPASATSAPPTLAATLAPPAPEPTAANTPEPTPAPALPVGTLALARGVVPQRLVAIMIDNHPQAYPQTGLDKAPLVFEALAEFGITRYMAVLAPGISPETSAIGPVRSARSYFVEWAMGLGAVFVHAGGSPDGLALAESATEIVNADALRRDAGAYFRREGGRAAPHNLFTDTGLLAKLVDARGAAAFDSASLGFLFKSDAPAAQRPAAQRLSYFFIYAEESAGWVYDPAANNYARLRRNRPHVDALTGQQLVFKNVLLIEVQEARRAGDAKGRIDQQVVGQGRGRLFMDGVEREVLWRKDSPAAPLRFYDADGTEVALNAGPTWVAALPSLENVQVEGGG